MMMRSDFSKTCRDKQWCFTLIEMLVVIAIISVLAAMLMPALGRAIDASRTMVCNNNLKQIGILATQYADDNKELYPAPRFGRPNSSANWGDYIWSVHLSKYASLDATNFLDKKLIGTVFDCPESPLDTWGRPTKNYGWNANLPPPHGWGGIETHASRTKIRQPSSTGMLSECSWFYVGWGTNYEIRHNDQRFIPLLYCDMHVKVLSELDYQDANMVGY